MNGYRTRVAQPILLGLLFAQGVAPVFGAVTIEGDTTEFTTIQQAINEAVGGETILIEAGTYAENLVVDVSLTLQGETGVVIAPASGNGITISANDVTLSALTVQGVGGASPGGYGIVPVSEVADLTIENVDVSGFNSGFHVGNGGGVSGLVITDSAFDGNRFGMYLTYDVKAEPMKPITDVNISNTSFSNNKVKGIYAERLDNAVLDHLTVTDSGTFEEPWPPGNGIDINLKWNAYSNITISNSTFTNSGWFVDEPAKGELSGALTVKARNDGTYASSAATLDGLVITGNQFVSSDARSQVGLRLGELNAQNASAGNVGPTNVTITGNTFTNFKRAFINATATPVTRTMMEQNTFVGNTVVLVRAGNVPFVYSDIQPLVDRAGDADQLLVGSGTYDSFLVPLDGPTDLTFTGADGATITRANGALARIVDLRADGASLSGFTIDGNGTHVGVSLTGKGITVEDNTITNVLTGIQTTTQYVDGDNVITGNTISSASHGISLQNNGNTVTGNTLGVSTEALGIGSAGNTVTGNSIVLSSTGGLALQTYTTTDYPALPGADIDLADVIDANSYNRLAYVTDGTTPVVQTLFGSIQPALDAAAAEATVVVGAGTYTGNLTIADEGLTLTSNDDAAIVGRINVNAADVTIRGLDISNPSAGYGIVVNGVGGVTISGNTLHDIGTTTAAGTTAQAIYIDDAGKSVDFSDITIADNAISGVGHAQGGTSKGVFIGDSVTTAGLSGVSITGNTISNVRARSDVVYANGGRGAYGIQVNYGYNVSSTGKASGVSIVGNTITDLGGFWAHAIGLEADTPSASVRNNTISNLRGTKLVVDTVESVSNDRTQTAFRDEVALWFEANASASGTTITGNRFSDLTWGLALSESTTPVAEQNWWGSSSGPGSVVLVQPTVDYDPWYVNVSLSQLSNFVPPPDDDVTPPPPPPPNDPIDNEVIVVTEEIQDIVVPGEGDVPAETVAAITTVLHSVDALAQQTAQQVASGTVNPGSAIAVLDTLGKALDLAGTASQRGAAVDPAATRASINGIANVIDALAKTGTGTAPTDVQMDAIRTVARDAVGSATKLVSGTTSAAQVSAVIGEVANLLDKSVSLGGALDTATTNTARTLSETALSSTLATVSASIGVTTPVNPADTNGTRELLQANPRLLGKVVEATSVQLPSSVKVDTAALSATLGNQGLSQATADKLAGTLGQFVNPEGVNLQQSNGTGLSAKQAMESSTGNAFGITVDAGTNAIKVANTERSIAVNVTKVALVPAAIPEGLMMLPDGSVLSVSGGLGVSIVPAANDPVALVSALGAAVDDITLKPNGGLTMRSGDSTFSGTFGFAGTDSQGGAGVTTVTFNDPPSGLDPSDPAYVYTVDYPDGSRQAVAPFVANDSFFDSLASRGLDFSTSRGTGVVTVSGAPFRPAYFVEPPDADALAFLANNADAEGIAYRATDSNGDGVLDFELISASGVQVIYGVRQ